MRKPKIQRSSVVLWIIVVFMLILVAVSMSLRRDDEELEVPAERAHPIHVVIVEARSVPDVVRLPSRLQPDVRAQLAVDKGGRITELLADKGDRVNKGDVLLRLDDRVWSAALAQAEIELREAERDYQRWTELSRTGSVSISEFDAVRARYDRARVGREEAQVHVDQCVVRSPSAGFVNRRMVELGEYAAEGVAVFELVVSDPVRLVIDVPERDIAAVSVGDSIPFIISILGDAEFAGEVTHIAEAASPVNNSYRIEATVPNSYRVLRPGMLAEARLDRGRRDDAVVVPLSSVLPLRGDHFVFVAQGERAVRRLVRIERILGSDAILSSGLEPGDELIWKGHRELVDGALIERVDTEDNPPAEVPMDLSRRHGAIPENTHLGS